MPAPPTVAPALPRPTSGRFTSPVALTPPAVAFSPQHLLPSNTNTSSAHHPDPASLLCSSCSFVARSIRELVAHHQSVHWDPSQPWQPIPIKHPLPASRILTAKEREQRVFKCPYCDVKVKGRQAIEYHVVNHSAGEEGPDRLYWCSFCTLKCRSAPGLSSHMKRHEYQGDC